MSYRGLSVHALMLGDPVRMAALERAVRTQVRPGDVVLDVGSGTGVLALLAARAGARRVVAVEPTGVAEVARAVVRENGFDGVIEVARCRLEELDRSVVEADVVIGEVLGAFAFEEGLFPLLVHARKNHLRPGGRMIPERVTLAAAPAAVPRLAAALRVWTHGVLGLAFRAGLEHAAATPRVERLAAADVLAGPATLATIDLATAADVGFAAHASFTIRRRAEVAALAGWFEATLAPGVRLSTAPGAPETHWKQLCFPIVPETVEAGTRIDADLTCFQAGPAPTYEWRCSIGGQAPVARTSAHALPGMDMRC